MAVCAAQVKPLLARGGRRGSSPRRRREGGRALELWTACGQRRVDNKNSHTTPGINQHNPQYANDWAPLTRKRHIPPHPAQRRHTNDGAPRTRKRHQQEHRPQRPTERSDPTQHAKGRTGDCPGPRKGATTGRNVTRGGVLKSGPREACVDSEHPPEAELQSGGTDSSATTPASK